MGMKILDRTHFAEKLEDSAIHAQDWEDWGWLFEHDDALRNKIEELENKIKILNEELENIESQ